MHHADFFSEPGFNLFSIYPILKVQKSHVVENNVVGLKNKTLLVDYDNRQELVRAGIKYELVQSDEG